MTSSQIDLAADDTFSVSTSPALCVDLPDVTEPEAGLTLHIRDVSRDEPKPAGSKPTIRKDPFFYCEIVVFKVEDTLFCVPKSGLIESGTYFSTLLNESASDSPSTTPPGSSDDNPIVLQGVLKDHFQHFLRLIYPFRGIKGPENDDQWLAILHLATEWNFSDIRETALHHLGHLFRSPSTTSPTHDPIRALQLCLKYNITQHLIHQYELLVTPIAPLKRDMLLAAGLDDDTIQLIRDMREEWLCGIAWRHYSPISLVDEGRELIPKRMSARFIVERHVNGGFTSPWTDTREDSYLSEEAGRLAEELISLQEKEWIVETPWRDGEGGLKEVQGPPLEESILIEGKSESKQRKDEELFEKVTQKRIAREDQQRSERLRKRRIAKEKMEEMEEMERQRQEKAIQERIKLEKEMKREAKRAHIEARKKEREAA
ncbi:hypothetical protein BJ165DRAFT_1402116 [Panaeolus papilionaceus]|nr:hypothetical protein BJ165DRAFT_1402116 [Panaeolus papilionaceus]